MSVYVCRKPILVGTAANEVDNIIKVAPAGSPAGVHYFQSLVVGRHERYFCQ